MQFLRTPAVGPARGRQPAPKARKVTPVAVPAPVGGWNSKSPLASMPETAAVQLKNWFPQPGYVEVRKGFKWHSWDIGSAVKTISAVDTGIDSFTSVGHGMAAGTLVKFHATTSLPGGLSASDSYYVISPAAGTFQVSQSAGGAAVDITSAGSGTIYVYTLSEPVVDTLAVYQGPTSSKLFAAAGGAIWDVSSNAAASLSYAASHASNRWQWTNFTTSAGAFVFMVNGSDAPIYYNGSLWTAPSITGITASQAIQVTPHKKRLWFTLVNSTKAAYLATEAVAGAATEFQFGSVFSRGGYLLTLATWTRDGGSGPDDYLVAISSRGQAAIYQGTDPDTADTWEHVGTFDVPLPIGRRCVQKFGADLLLLTVEGVFPFSKLLAVDQSQVTPVALSDAITPDFSAAARSYGTNHGWEICVYPRGTRLLVNIPTTEGATAKQYVMNSITQAWCEFDNHNATCWAHYGSELYFAGGDGDVYQADTGSADIDTPVTATGQSAYSVLTGPQIKRFSMIRPLCTVSGTNRPSVGISTDFVETSAMSTLPSASSAAGATWDSSVWDSASWSTISREVNDWANATALGTFASVRFSAQTGVETGGGAWGVGTWGSLLWGSGGRADETMKIQGFVVLYEDGDFV